MLDTASLTPVLERAFARALAHAAGEGADVPGDLEGQARLFAHLKARHGRKALGARLGLAEAELEAFDAVVRDVDRTRARTDAADAAAEQNALIARVRLLSWLETVGQRLPDLGLEAGVEALVSEDVGRKQVRAIELIVRSLIGESYGDQVQLVSRLREALGDTVVDKWLAAADAGDVLSGCTFGELASLFCTKEEFTRYERLYEGSPYLTLLRQRRRTAQLFLDDIRRIRNVLAHNKRVSTVQLALLDLYYQEIVQPVQEAHDEGGTRVDPSTFLEVTREELDGYFRRLGEDVQAVRDDLGELKTSVLASLGGIAEGTQEIRQRTRGMDRKLVGIGLGVAALLVAAFFLFSQGRSTQDAVEEARTTGARTEGLVKDTAAAVRDVDETTRRTAETVERTAASAEKTAEDAARAKAAADEAARQARETAAKVEASTEKVVETLEQLRDGFAALARTGGTIPNATRAEEHYHNARVFEERGDALEARRSYLAYFAATSHPFVDPHLRFAALLRLQEGAAGAREVYHDLQKRQPGVATELAWTLLLEDEARRKGLEALVAREPEFAPAWYALSRESSVARLGSQSVADKRAEKASLERFLALEGEGKLLGFYLDPSLAVEQVEDARERLAAVSSVAAEALENPVKLSGSRSNAGWMITLSIADAAKEVFYRIGGEGPWQSTGFLDAIHPQTGLPMPKPYFELVDAARTTIDIRYTDPRGRELGPFSFPFDPDAEMLKSVRSILDMTKSSWVAFRDWDGKVLVYFSHLLSYRAALKEIRYGVDVETPDRTFAFPPADPKNPYAVDTDAPIWIEVPEATRFVTVQVTFSDGEASEVVRVKR